MIRIWTLREEQIIRKYYRRERTKGVHKRMPYRTHSSISNKAYRMGIQFYQRKSPHRPWTTQELRILKRFYPIEGSECYKRLRNRSRRAIRATDVVSRRN